MPVDHFPSTHATWIDAQLTIAERAGSHTEDGQSARRALQQHLMQRYHEPLRAYVRGSSMRQLGDTDELVGGFFAVALLVTRKANRNTHFAFGPFLIVGTLVAVLR